MSASLSGAYHVIGSPQKYDISDTNKDVVVFNPRGSIYDSEAGSESRLMTAYRNVSDWSSRQQRAARTAIPRGYHWLILSWAPAHLWRSATVCGILGVVCTIALLFKMAADSGEDPLAPAREGDSVALTTIDGLPSSRPSRVIEHHGSMLPETKRSGPVYVRPALPPWDLAQVEQVRVGEMPRVKFTLTSPLWARKGLTPNVGTSKMYSATSVAAYADRPGVRLSQFDLAAPASLSSDLPGFVRGDGAATSGFRVVTDWPRNTSPGQTVMLRVHVTNVSARDAEDVRIRQSFSALDRVAAAYPPAAVVGQEFVWEEGVWPAGESRTYSLEVVGDSRTLRGTTSVDVLSRMANFATTVDSYAPTPEPFYPLSQERRPAEPVETLPDNPLLVEERPVPERPTLAPSPDPELLGGGWPFRSEIGRNLEVTPIEPDKLPDAPVVPRTIVPDNAFVTGTALKMQMTLPETRIGEVATIRFIVTNVGPLASEQTLLKVMLPRSLRHPMGRELQLPIGRLAPGDSFRTQLYADVIDADVLTVSAITEADNARREQADGILPVIVDTSTRIRRANIRPPQSVVQN